MGHLPQDIYDSRLDLLRSKFDEWDIEAVLVTNDTNRRWLSGFTGTTGILLISIDRAVIATDSRYWEQVIDQVTHFSLFKMRGSIIKNLVDLIDEIGVHKIAFEAEHVSVDQYDRMQQLDQVEWKKIANLVSTFRTIKVAEEIESIRAAARITDEAMEKVPLLARIGMTERQLAWELEKLMRDAGASELAFPVIVASGPNSARPHHMTGDRALQIGDTVIIDMGAKLNGYCSDLTRTFHLGATNDEQFGGVYNIVLQAQTNALENMRAGMASSIIDALARDVIKEAGFGDNFGHGLGHGIGLDIHENPRLSWANEEIIDSGVAVTVEPGVYLPGWGGVRIEDLIQVTDDGIEFLSECPKTPMIPV